ncbi:hypothetical protein ACFE04_029009 [Oxalis oulophora]
MAKLTFLLQLVIILISVAWITIWVLKPTTFWNKTWKQAEDSANSTVFGYYSLDFAVLTLPVIFLAVIGLVYLHLQQIGRPRSRQPWSATSSLSKPLVVNGIVGILSGIEILVVCLFILFLTWTFYARISNDFNKLLPVKSLDLNTWQLKYLRVSNRSGLLAEACLALLLLPILRVLAVFRILGLQFELSVKYHIWLGTAMIFFATFHGASTLFIWGVSHYIHEEIWKWQKTGRIYLAGEIALVTGLVIFITSLHPIRRKMFEIFYYTHHLFVVFLVFVLFHVGDRHFYWVFPGIFLFGIDKLLRIVQSKPGSFVLSAGLYPCKAVELTLPKDPRLKYTPTSVVFMKIPMISNLEWHSFSITSSSRSDDYTMSLTIKCDGEWTNSLYEIIQAELKSDIGSRGCIPIAIEGPYGPPSANFLRYDSLLLIAGGIGITPFLSILKEISSSESSICKLPTRIQLIYVAKSSKDISLLNSISSLMLNNSTSKKCHLKLKVFVTREEQSAVTTRELLNDLSKVQTVYFNKASSKYAVYGLENPIWVAAIVGVATIMFLISLICFNHIFVPLERKNGPSMKLVVKSEKEKTPSWIADLIIIGSYLIAIACSAIMAIILRARGLKEEIPSVNHKQNKGPELSLTEKTGATEEHEIHFGGRPNFSDIFSKFQNETGGGDIGVLVCGPESMRESVASLCQVKSQGGDVNSRWAGLCSKFLLALYFDSVPTLALVDVFPMRDTKTLPEITSPHLTTVTDTANRDNESFYKCQRRKIHDSSPDGESCADLSPEKRELAANSSGAFSPLSAKELGRPIVPIADIDFGLDTSDDELIGANAYLAEKPVATNTFSPLEFLERQAKYVAFINYATENVINTIHVVLESFSKSSVSRCLEDYGWICDWDPSLFHHHVK